MRLSDKIIKKISESDLDKNHIKYIGLGKFEFKCFIHGNFNLHRSNLYRNVACPKCSKIKRGKKLKENKLKLKFKGLIQPKDYKLIPSTKGKFAKVDNEDFEELSKYNWYYNESNKTIAHNGVGIARIITKCKKGYVVDHINGDGLDNRKSNLRICTQKDNLKNRKYWGKNWHEKYNGVIYNKLLNKWSAVIKDSYEFYFIGNFETDLEAAKAFDEYAKKYNKHIRLNFNNEQD